MPIFEYRCKNCGNLFEILIRTSEQSHLKCPSCESCEVKKLLSSFNAGQDTSSMPLACNSKGKCIPDERCGCINN